MEEIFVSTLKQSLMITVFVLFMMVVIEYINVQSKNLWAEKLRQSPFLQIIIAALLGITPGCMGAFTVVSLYTHRMMGLAGLVTVMIATSGDEAFVMFALFPGKALLLNVVLLTVAIVSGWLVHLFNRKSNIKKEVQGYVIHEQEYCKCFTRHLIVPQLKAISFERAILLLFILLFTVMLLAGIIGNSEWDWKKITFLSGSLFLLFVFITVPEHFLKEHLYEHILKKHLLRLFLWTWGAFIALHFIQTNIELSNLLQNNSSLVLLSAVLLGLIPESGPHLLFVTLFSQSLLPFSILLANSIVQDGHGMLPLLAESRKDFVRVKAINMLVGLLIGFILLQFGL
ncbi:MAG: arsenic efflux protein [Bacteroidales bacterium]|nr:arsenic efflux protein [Bacteroidales bacterium]